MQFNKAIPEFSVTGLVGAYIAWVSMTGADVPVEPFWLVAIAVALFFALGLWRAYANDGKITPEEVHALFGLSKAEFDMGLEEAKKLQAAREKLTEDAASDSSG